MNISLSQFRLTSLSQSAFISRSIYSKSSSSRFLSIFANKFSSSFFKSFEINSKTEFIECKFKNFLATPIHINSDRFTEIKFKKSEIFSSNSTASFKQCIFVNCENTEKKGKGGGMCYNNNDGKVLMQNCGFDNCSAEQGGAFVIKCKSYTFTYTCINHCFAFDKYSIFKLFGNVFKSADAEFSLFEHSTFFENGPMNPVQEKFLCQFNDINTRLENINFSNSRQSSKFGVIKISHKSPAPEVAMMYSNFFANKGPGLLSVTQPFEKNQNFPIFETCNFVANEPGNGPLISINEETRCGFKSCVFAYQNPINTGYLLVEKGSIVMMNKCVSDAEINYFKLDIIGKFKTSSCSFGVPAPAMNEIAAVDVDSCFEFAVTATFSPSPTKVKKEDAKGKPVTFLPTLQFTPSRPLYPKAILIQQYSLFIVAFIAIPFFFLMHFMRQRQFAGRPRKTSKRSQK